MVKIRKDSKGNKLNPGEYQRSNGRYVYAYYDRDGKRRFVSAVSIFELRKKTKIINAKIAKGLDPKAADKITLNELFDLYISQADHLAPQTRFNYKDIYDRHVRPEFGEKKISDIRYSDVKDFYNAFLNTEIVRGSKKGKKRSVRSLKNLHTPLYGAFEVAVKDELLDRNPCKDALKDYRKTREWKMSIKEKKALTEEEQKAFLNFLQRHSKYDSWISIMVVLFGTGLRIGECLSLKWSDIDWDKKMINVETTYSYRRVYGKEHAEKHNGMVKTIRSIRKIPIFPEVYAVLQQEYEDQSIIGFCEEVIDGYSGFIFTNTRGGKLSGSSVNGFIKRAIMAYNEEETENAKNEGRDPLLLPDFSCHATRHSFCTRSIDAGIPPYIAQAILGHASIQTTIDRYTSITEKRLKDYENYHLFDEDFLKYKNLSNVVK